MRGALELRPPLVGFPDLVVREVTPVDQAVAIDAVNTAAEHLRDYDEDPEGWRVLYRREAGRADTDLPLLAWLGSGQEAQAIGGASLSSRGEVSYWLDENYTGHGYATAMVQAVVKYATRRCGLVFAAVRDSNEASQRVLLRSGARREGVAGFKYGSHGHFFRFPGGLNELLDAGERVEAVDHFAPGTEPRLQGYHQARITSATESARQSELYVIEPGGASDILIPTRLPRTLRALEGNGVVVSHHSGERRYKRQALRSQPHWWQPADRIITPGTAYYTAHRQGEPLVVRVDSASLALSDMEHVAVEPGRGVERSNIPPSFFDLIRQAIERP